MSLISEFNRTKNKKYLQEFYNQESYKKELSKITPKLKRKFKLIVKLMNVKKGDKILDVGCGPKQLKPFIERFGGEYYGLDLGTRFNPNFVCDAEELSKINVKFDWIIFADILEHIPHPEKAVEEAFKIGENVIAVCPNLYRLNSLTFLPSHPNDKHIIKKTPFNWLKLFGKHKIVYVRGFFYCLSVAFWPKMGIIDMFFRIYPFLLISDFFDKYLADKRIFKYLGQELIIVAKK